MRVADRFSLLLCRGYVGVDERVALALDAALATMMGLIGLKKIGERLWREKMDGSSLAVEFEGNRVGVSRV